jgi:tight adherence protein B
VTPALALLTGLAVLLTCLVLALVRARREARLARHLAARLEGLRPAIDRLDAERLSQSWLARLSRRLPYAVQVRLARADIDAALPQLLLPVVAVILADIVVVRFFNPLLAIAVTGAAMLLAVVLFQMLAARRMDAFVESMPGLFDLIKHLLLAGNSLQQALVKAIESSTAQAQRYLRPVARRVQNGAPVAESILWLADRLDAPELFIFGTGVQTNSRYGGRMSLMLGNLSQIVRDGLRVRRELRSATAETRLSAIVLSLLPIGVSVVIAFANPGYMHFFVETTQGRHMAMVAVGLQVLGMLIMRRILRIEY